MKRFMEEVSFEREVEKRKMVNVAMKMMNWCVCVCYQM